MKESKLKTVLTAVIEILYVGILWLLCSLPVLTLGPATTALYYATVKRTSLLTCITLASVLGLRQFEQVYMLTNGGPANRTSTMVLYMYKKLQDTNYGMASASAVILIVVGVIFIVCIRALFSIGSDEAKAKKNARRAVR